MMSSAPVVNLPAPDGLQPVVWYRSAGANPFWRMDPDQMVSILATAMGGEMCLGDSEGMGSIPRSNPWSNLFIIGMYPAASARRHILIPSIQNIYFDHVDRVMTWLSLRRLTDFSSLGLFMNVPVTVPKVSSDENSRVDSLSVLVHGDICLNWVMSHLLPNVQFW